MVRTPGTLKCPRAMSKVEGVVPLARVKSAPSCGGWRAVGGRESSRGRVKPVNSMWRVSSPRASAHARGAHTRTRLRARGRRTKSAPRKVARERFVRTKVAPAGEGLVEKGRGGRAGRFEQPARLPARRGARLHASEVGVAEAGADGGAAPEGRRAQLCRAQVCAVGEETTIRRHVRRTTAH